MTHFEKLSFCSEDKLNLLNPLSASVALIYIETSQSICTANQLTGFYMRATLALNWLSETVSRTQF